MQFRQEEKKTYRGSMTVMFCLMSVLILSLATVSIRSVQQASFRALAAESIDLGLYSVFGQYDKELLEEYDQFYFDASFGSGSMQPAKVLQLLEAYTNATLQSEYTDRSIKQSGFTQYVLATDQNGNVWKKQAVSFMKDSIGIQGVSAFLQQLTDNQQTIENQEQQADQANADNAEDAYEQQLAEQSAQEETSNVAMESHEVKENPIDKIREVKKMGILALVVPKSVVISGKLADTSQMLSNRTRNTGLGAQDAITFSQTEDLLYQEYCVQRLSCFGKVKTAGVLDYQLEYMLSGKASDEENLKEVVKQLLAMREAANYTYLATNTNARQQCAAFALTLASSLGIPQAIAVVEVVLRLCWAYGESLLDVRTLLAGGNVPLVKDSESWKLSVDRLFYILDELQNAGQEPSKSGMDYAAYLRLLLFMQQNKSDQTMRSLDMIESNIRKVSGKEGFCLDCCIQSFSVEGIVQDAQGKEYVIARNYSYQM